MSKVKASDLLEEVQKIVETKFNIPKGRQLLKDQEDNKIDIKTIKRINNRGAIRAFLDYNVKIIITYAKNKETLEVPFNLETDRLELLHAKVTEKWKLDKSLQTFVINDSQPKSYSMAVRTRISRQDLCNATERQDDNDEDATRQFGLAVSQ
ncbi:hypothetical protein DdX_15464 [Ditylenchus destructor]|uniref:Uncharacterized protein n=1 Tax=Ditylenchus destructor TaxID=166010 RepID=A0AAD4MUX7_9BILA|nr:hypothetical protein DdX_15464 [Ditylenchus destructor]